MDNRKGTEMSGEDKREALLKVLTGDEVGVAVLTALIQLGLIKTKDGIKDRIGLEAWYPQPTTQYELTKKGLERLNGL